MPAPSTRPESSNPSQTTWCSPGSACSWTSLRIRRPAASQTSIRTSPASSIRNGCRPRERIGPGLDQPVESCAGRITQADQRNSRADSLVGENTSRAVEEENVHGPLIQPEAVVAGGADGQRCDARPGTIEISQTGDGITRLVTDVERNSDARERTAADLVE